MKAIICDQCKKHIEKVPVFKWRGVTYLNLGLACVAAGVEKEFCSKECALKFLTELEPE
jgi:hypothetical protein